MDHKPTPEQEEIIRWFRKGSGNLIIEARAGSAKTTTITEGAIQAPEKTVLLCAFNRHSALALTEKLAVVPTTNRLLHASTLHSAGYKIIQHHWKKIQLRENRTEELARKVFERAKVPKRFKLVRAIIDTCSKVKSALPLAETVDDVILVGEDFDTLAPEKDLPWDLQATLVLSTLELAKQYDGTVDYSDMDWLPVANNWDPPGRYRLVIVDECFAGDTPILLADGTNKPIKEIVEENRQIEVLSFDPLTNEQVKKRVVGCKRTILRTKTVRIKVQPLVKKAPNVRKDGRPFNGAQGTPYHSISTSSKLVGCRLLVCTADHQIFTQRGWVAAQDLTTADIVQVESEAPRDYTYNHKYKHSVAGKAQLAANLAQRAMPRAKPLSKEARKHKAVLLSGGNGAGLTLPQQELLSFLGSDWNSEFVVPTGLSHEAGFPHHYKLDLAHPGQKIAVECDGHSHTNPSRKEADLRKNACLQQLGWRVFRYRNKDVLRNTPAIADFLKEQAQERCSGQGCPIPGVVLGVEEHDIDDQFVYDLSVEDTNCYYAHGILVHNCQDTSSTQLMLAKKMVAPPFGRLAFVGDVFQSIYQWRGADRYSLTRIRQDLPHTTLPLTTSFRCSKSVVREAQLLVPDIKAMEDAPEGKVTKIIFPEVALRAQPGDFILSRTNAPLVSVCISLRHAGVKAFIDGKEDLKKLKNVLKKIDRTGKDLHSFEHDVNAWMQKEVAMARARGSVARSQRAFDYGMLLGRLAREAHSMREIEEILEDLFHGRKNKNDNGEYMQVICATVHRVKGLESNRVFILRDTLPRYQAKTFFEIDDEEERNIEYVAITRARTQLFWVVGLPDNPLGVREDEDGT